MSLFPRHALATFSLCVASMTAAMPSFAEELDDQINQRPSAMAMAGDAIFARPVLLALTLGGTATFVASLPFTALGGNVEEAAKTLVIGPAKSTFTRCMGCTATQDEWKNQATSKADN
ncbi:hypothetical protein [Agitococcus lubricus]|uniref:Multidrug transporter n=1 Tax=Agitococcus lubricus TaxID=1077255 RepID=A0A2T5IZY6_9GAMM|nr:hypothetical protein [Agitococcus lubricus]PTQ89626.1 hypothetical protein C8N29_106157 [Agitococcus lubricus]